MVKPKTKNPGRKKRKTRQRKKERFMKLREDLQLAGEIPTEAEGAVRDERVDPASQEQQELLNLDCRAINSGWAVPEEDKPRIISTLIEKINGEETSPAEAAMCANAVIKADQIQFERNFPDRASRAKGQTQVNNIIVPFSWDELHKVKEVDEVEKRIEEVEKVEAPSNGEAHEGDEHDNGNR